MYYVFLNEINDDREREDYDFLQNRELFSLIFLHSEKNIHHTRKKKKLKSYFKRKHFLSRQSASSTKPGKYYQSTCRLSLLHN